MLEERGKGEEVFEGRYLLMLTFGVVRFVRVMRWVIWSICKCFFFLIIFVFFFVDTTLLMRFWHGYVLPPFFFQRTELDTRYR